MSDIEIDTRGSTTKVILNGIDLSTQVTKVSFEHDPEGTGYPLVTLTLLCDHIHIRTVGSVAAERYDLWVYKELQKKEP